MFGSLYYYNGINSNGTCSGEKFIIFSFIHTQDTLDHSDKEMSPITLMKWIYILTFITAIDSKVFHAGVINSTSKFKYDENGHVQSNTLVYPLACAGLMESSGIKSEGQIFLHPVTGEAELAFFPNGGILEESKNIPKMVGDCRAVCVERGVHSSLVTSAMPYLHYNGHKDSGPFKKWFVHNCLRVEVCFMNYHSKTPIKRYWVTPSHEERENGTPLKYGEPETACFHSYLGHRFVLRDGNTNEIVLDVTVEHALIIAAGKSYPDLSKNHNFEVQIKNQMNVEWERHKRIKRTCSSLGFKKGRLPNDVFASIGAFYYNNKKYKVPEELNKVFVNWWEADLFFVQIPWAMKAMWQQRLLELVEAWAGDKLEQTSMYGLRQYEEGSRLITHVDREQTHAFSLIINIAQENVSEPWPVEIYDHADRLHEVAMEAGDIVYYESAKCLHGRNKPLKGNGAYYVNLFTHYRPVGDPKWYEKSNTYGTPEALFNVGNCKLEGSIDDIGVGAVTCDNERIGKNLSPTMFTASSGDDLFNWWKIVGSQGIIESVGDQNNDSDGMGSEL